MTPPRLFIAFACLALMGGAAVADVINVPADYPTIQGAIDASSDGDVINIAAGTYNEFNLNPGGKAITIQGTLNSDGSLETTIDAQQGGRVFRLTSQEDSGTVIQNLVITRGTNSIGGGIYCNNSNPTITGCTISGNTGDYGGGIYCYNSSPTINNCTISGNSGLQGGGVYCRNNSNPTISDCTISGNTASNGGGIFCIYESNATISGCTILSNTANYSGGGINTGFGGSHTIIDCRISGNTASSGGGIYNHYNGDSISILTDTNVCGNDPDQIYGDWTDDGGNTVQEACSFVIHVPGDYPTIQAAVDAANNGDEIIVAPGTYTSTQDGHVVDMKGKAVTLRSSDGPKVTIIDGENARRGIACFNGETESTLIEGFTITKGFANWYDYDGDGTEDPWEDDGGGILCYQSNLTISGCTILDNTGNSSGNSYGGGIFCYGSSSFSISNCIVRNNTTTTDYIAGGGGIYCGNSNATISGCTIDGNTTSGGVSDGGGINCSSSGHYTIADCTISGNIAISESNPFLIRGGGIYCQYCNATISGCTISSNTASSGGGSIYGGGIYNGHSSNNILADTIVCGNTGDQIYGDWTDDGGNQVSFTCPGPCAPFAQDFGFESGNESGAIEMAVSGNLAVVLEESPDQDFWNVLCYHREQGQWQLEAVRSLPSPTYAVLYPCKRVDFSGDLVIVRPDVSPDSFAIFNRDRGNWTEESPSAHPGAGGTSVAISGNFAVTGNPSQNPQDSHAIVYQRGSEAIWTQQDVLTCPLSDITFFATDVAIDGSNLIVSSLVDGAFYYRYNGSSWQYIQHLTHPDVTLLGTSVDISGDVAVIGSYYDQSPAGTEGAMVFRLTNGIWVPEQRLDSPNVIDLGFSVRIDGDLIVATSGMNFFNADGPGKAHVFRYDDGSWVEIDRIEYNEVPNNPWLISPRISISGLQVATANIVDTLYFQDITLHTYPPPGEPSGLDCNANDRCDELDLASGNSEDCNGNAVPDECDIADGISIDQNADGIPDECQCLGDINSDGEVGVDDILLLLSEFGSDCMDGCDSDLNGDGQVNVDDILALLGYYGTTCP